MNSRMLKTRTFLVAVALLAMPLAGCIGGDGGGADGQTLGYASFDEAANADGQVYQAVNADSAVQLKLLQPADTTSVPTGDTPVVFLLYDADASEPVTDADVTIKAMMPAMGHGTSGEEDPTHRAHGIYQGKTVLSMPGAWIINLDATLANGDTLEFDVEVQAGGGGSSDDGGMDHGNMSMDMGPRTFDSFAKAQAATGTTLEAATVTPPTLTKSAGDTFTDLQYSTQVPFQVADRPVATATLAGAFNATLPAGAELNATVLGPDGSDLGTLVLTPDEPSGELTLDALAGAGSYQLNVTARGLNASYALDLTVTYEPRDLTVKLLDPQDPNAAKTGKQPVVVLLSDASASEPVTTATVDLESFMPMMGHGSSGEEAPTHEAHGQYVGKANWMMMGSWQLNLTVTLPIGDVFTYEVPIEVTEEGSDDGGTEMKHSHGGDGHSGHSH